MISVTNPCSEKPDIKDGRIVTSKSDKKNHGFGISNIRSAAEDCGGELSVSCEEKPFGFLFRAEVVIGFRPGNFANHHFISAIHHKKR